MLIRMSRERRRQLRHHWNGLCRHCNKRKMYSERLDKRLKVCEEHAKKDRARRRKNWIKKNKALYGPNWKPIKGNHSEEDYGSDYRKRL